MANKRSPLREMLCWTAVIGNIIFIIFILYNGINESLQSMGIISIYLLALLLVVDTYLLLQKRSDKKIL